MMKKFLVMVLMMYLMASMFCITAYASDTVLRVSGQKSDGTLETVSDHADFAEGWEAAVDLAGNKTEMSNKGFQRVVVDFYADWNANEIGEFGDSDDDGFQFSTIYVPKKAKLTLNLNGHTINRGLKEWEYDGEVIYINTSANVIINNGTITGGFSCNGAGGIHISDKATVVLNNVNVMGNNVEDDDGAGIALYNGATLTMKGGCVSDNTSYSTVPSVHGGGVYIKEATASFIDVTFQNNHSADYAIHGAAVYVDDGTLEMDGCQVMDNGRQFENKEISYTGAYTIVDISGGSHATIKNTEFLRNGCALEVYTSLNTEEYTAVIKVKASRLTMEDECKFTDNNQVYLIMSEAGILTVRDTDFTGNDSFAFYGNCANISNNTFTNCLFSYQEPMLNMDSTFYFNIRKTYLTFIDCDFGGSTFNDVTRATFMDSHGNTINPSGSIFGSGSISMVIFFIALTVLIALVSMRVVLHKKKAMVAAAVDEAESEENHIQREEKS